MKIMVEFILWSDNLPVDKVINEIGIHYTEKLIKDEIRLIGPQKNIPKVNETSSITYSTGYVKSIDVKRPIEIMYNMLYKHQKAIVKIIEKYNINPKFCIVINLTDNPIIELSNKFITLASELHAEIEFDTYIN